MLTENPGGFSEGHRQMWVAIAAYFRFSESTETAILPYFLQPYTNTCMNDHEFFSFLEKRVRKPLPGLDAQLRMAPSPLDGIRNYRLSAGDNANVSSIMILLFTSDEQKVETVLTLRTDSITHGGQISFPGGQSDPGERAEETALREMQEEIGVSQHEVSVAGRISRLYLHHSNNLITPVVGVYPKKPKIEVNPNEVQEAFTVSLDSLLNEKNLVREPWKLRNKTYEVPYWNIHRVPLWGATAMILSELLELYREFLRSSGN